MTAESLTFEEISLRLYKYCLSLTSSQWLAEDLTQETIIKWIKIREKEPERVMNITFLYTIARNIFIDEKRKKTEILTDPHELFAKSWDFTEWDSLLEILYSTLPLRQAMLITLKDVFLYTTEEIAAMLRVSNESIKTALHRARTSLKKNTSLVTKKQPYKDNLLKEFSLAVKNQQPLKIFYYYRLLQTEHFKVIANREKGFHAIFISDPDGNILQIFSR
ncbi:RNA polymerase sigma factor [Cytobacillus firmus]|uniref:RNA polymerase sigma factor n=1 Tax=Cytobacillus firmus TaxID=1399 RepID=UPI001C8E799A|nr:RNA polymerase sigma factor [Cytobacillus firmus]MBX9976028.1 RNA polymerase sigma factor [Cytobacillus firmus]